MYAISDSDAYPSEREAVERLAPQPRSIRETGLADNLLGDLLCKHLHDAGVLAMPQLVERLALTGAVLEEILAFLRKDGRVEVLGQAAGQTAGQGLRYGLTERGRSAARDALARSGYIGAAPYPVSSYRSLLKVQTIHHGRITARDMRATFGGVVLSEGMLDQLGVALNSGRAIMIYGPAGTGKTYISSRLIRLFAEAIWVPYAIAINEAVIEIYDPQVHQRLDDPDEQQNSLMLSEGIDRRLLCCKRPVLITGGELSMEQLDIRYDPFSRQYQAPLQLKASNGLFIIDDMGRQRMAPAELLNRWIVPMEEKRDFLNLGGGRHCELPFDLVLVFSTNLNPLELADEAFLRRIGYKLHFNYLKAEEYERIWRQECERLGIAYDPVLLRYVLQGLYETEGMPLVPCHPRDLLSMALDRQRYLDGSGPLSPRELEWAWHNYFIQLDFLG